MKDLWISVSGAMAQKDNIDVIANNIANVNTPGFKKDQNVFKEYLIEYEEGVADLNLPEKVWTPEDFYKSYGQEKGFVKNDGTYSDLSQGSLYPTNNPLDLAIKGVGFFEILTPNGVRYTRKGNFSLNNNNEIVTNDGHFLLSKQNIPQEKSENTEDNLLNFEERKIKLPHKFSIDHKGNIFNESNSKISEISIREFNDTHFLKKEGHSLFINPDLKNALNNSNHSIVHQGFIEQSNVNILNEMNQLIQAHRQFENIQKVIKSYDQMEGRAVNDILKF